VGNSDWRDRKYDEVFEDSIRGLERRKAADPSFSLSDAQGTLSHLYVRFGNDWEGRGELQDIVLSATIAAYEHFIAEWKARPQGAESAKE
jgi:hypothetical protein